MCRTMPVPPIFTAGNPEEIMKGIAIDNHSNFPLPSILSNPYATFRVLLEMVGFFDPIAEDKSLDRCALTIDQRSFMCGSLVLLVHVVVSVENGWVINWPAPNRYKFLENTAAYKVYADFLMINIRLSISYDKLSICDVGTSG